MHLSGNWKANLWVRHWCVCMWRRGGGGGRTRSLACAGTCDICAVMGIGNSNVIIITFSLSSIFSPSRSKVDHFLNPWLTEEYKSNYSILVDLMLQPNIRRLCSDFLMITDPMSGSITKERDVESDKELFLAGICETRQNFVLFREVLRANRGLSGVSEAYLADLDSVGPDPVGKNTVNNTICPSMRGIV